MNKKAAFDTTHELMIWIPRIIILVIVVGIVYSLITIPVQKNFEIDTLQEKILRQRFVYSENCLAYEDNNVYSGIIDKNKFTQTNLENCFQFNNNIGVNLNLMTNDVKTINLNERLSNKFDFCFDKDHFTCSNYTYYILTKENNKFVPGLLNIAMIKLK